MAVHNIADGQGDELIRMIPLLQGFLDYNHKLEITIITNREFLYDHPRVKVFSVSDVISDGKDWHGFQTTYDILINHSDIHQTYSFELNKTVPDFNLRNKSYIYIESNKSNDSFIYEKILIDGSDMTTRLNIDPYDDSDLNVYKPPYRLSAEFGLPLRVGENFPTTESLITGTPYPKAEKIWHKMISQTNNNSDTKGINHPIILLNPYGGESENKGFNRKERSQEELKTLVRKLVSSGCKVVILPNGTTWGTKAIADTLFDSLPKNIQQNVIVADEPSTDPKLFKYFTSYADYILTVEGGLMHLAFNLGKPFGVILKSGAGGSKWLPYGRSSMQEVISDEGDIMPQPSPRDSLNSHEKDNNQNHDTTGGIDFNPDTMRLQTTRESVPAEFKINPAILQKLQAADGFIPIIMNIYPANLTEFLKTMRRQ